MSRYFSPAILEIPVSSNHPIRTLSLMYEPRDCAMIMNISRNEPKVFYSRFYIHAGAAQRSRKKLGDQYFNI